MKKRKRTAESESVFLNGIEFRRYPNSKNWSDRVYFRPGGSDAKRGIKAYHIELWKFVHHSEVPKDCEIHHIDGNPLNNNVMNLTSLPSDKHQEKHGDNTKSREYIDNRKENLDRIRPLAAKWHKSADGREWHSNHGKEIWRNRTQTEKECQYCKKKYLTPFPSRSKFCSEYCKDRNRVAQGRKKLYEGKCVICGSVFSTVNRDTKCCSKSCGAKLRWKIRKHKSSI